MFRFIKATEEFNTLEKNIPAPYLRKSFFSDKETTGSIRIAACGFYKIYINGTDITKGYLAPYICNTDDYIYYDEYSVSLYKGENVIGILLGNGFQNNPGGYIWDFDKAPFRSAPKVAMSLKYEGADGETLEITTDETFKTHPSPILFDDYRFGEIYDANFEIQDWNKKGFDDADWQNAIPTEPPKGEIKFCEADPIIKETEIEPVRIFKEGDAFIYDFGISNAGVCRLCVDGEKGQKIEFQHADILKDGKFFLDNVWFVREFWERDKHIVHKDTYICKGEGKEVYTPTFTYHGFRYVKVTGIKDCQATKDLLTFNVLHSDLKTRGGFSCSDETVNKLQEITRRSDISNFHYFPTDCPQREKNGWTADAALSSEQLTLNFSPENSYREWLNNVRKAQTEKGSLPGIVPTTGWGFEWGNGPAWDCALVYIPYYTYVYRGQTEMITESADAFIKYLKYLESRKDEKGLICFGLGDWCYVGYTDDMLPKTPLIVTDSVISMDIAKKVAFLLKAVGLNEQAKYADEQYKSYKKAIRENLVDFEQMAVEGNCQTSQAMGLYYDVFEGDERKAAFDVLLKLIHETDDHIDLGVLGGRVIFHVLSDFGYTDLALKMITRPDYPSYGNWLKRGATTLWENFAPDSVNSANHHFWGDISAWFIKTLAGINYNPDGNDLKRVLIKPHFAKSLQNAQGFYDSPYGKILSSWKRNGETVELTVDAPDDIKIEVRLPEGYSVKTGNAKVFIRQ
ncbi:MAG: family 78 glycoside hydrolase catalytic domain [Clostridia bacterium]|nr:family 78 glycoside hydrolase catalytic domain [Clostridia bacterium]